MRRSRKSHELAETSRHTVGVRRGDEPERERIASDAIREMYALIPSLGSFRVEFDKRVPFAVAFGWWIRVIRTAEGLRLMHQAGLAHESSPLLRTILHHTAAIEWLTRDPEEVLDALREEHEQRRHTLGEKARQRDWDLTEVDLGSRPPKKKVIGLEYLRQFEQMCDRIGVANLYVAYMLESTYSHASGLSADAYLDLDEQGWPRLRDTAALEGVPLTTTAMFAATATSIVGGFIQDDRLTTIAAAVGDRLQVPVTLVDAAKDDSRSGG